MNGSERPRRVSHAHSSRHPWSPSSGRRATGGMAYEQWNPMGTNSVTPASTHIRQRVRSVFRDTMNPHPSRAAPRLYKGLHLRGWGGALCGEAVHDLDQLQSKMGMATPWEARGGTAGRTAQAVRTPTVGEWVHEGEGERSGSSPRAARPWTPAELLLLLGVGPEPPSPSCPARDVSEKPGGQAPQPGPRRG